MHMEAVNKQSVNNQRLSKPKNKVNQVYEWYNIRILKVVAVHLFLGPYPSVDQGYHRVLEMVFKVREYIKHPLMRVD
jgi:hypothetical protein